MDVLLLHGFPESSYMWRDTVAALEVEGHRCLAPDLPGYGDEPPDRPATWERMVEYVERKRSEERFERLVLVVHDWGGLIGLRWAAEHPEAVAAMVISDTGFFSDGKWHDFAAALRTPDVGEQAIAAFTHDGFVGLLKSLSHGITDDAIDEYWKAFESEDGRAGVLDLYRSGDFEQTAWHEHEIGKIDAPSLLLWGADDQFAPLAGAERLAERLKDARLVTLDNAGHFAPDDQPSRYAAEVARFVNGL